MPTWARMPEVPDRPSRFSVVVSCTASTSRSVRHRSTVCSTCEPVMCSILTASLDINRQAATCSAAPGRSPTGARRGAGSRPRPSARIRRLILPSGCGLRSTPSPSNPSHSTATRTSREPVLARGAGPGASMAQTASARPRGARTNALRSGGVRRDCEI